MLRKSSIPFWSLLLLMWLLAASSAFGQGTAFTYQGKLTDGSSPANGTYDFRFKLFDTAALGTGTEFGTAQTLTGVAVSSGIFTVQLDFGACPTCFTGAARFLEIAVKPTSSGTFTPLDPRQPLSSTPYAIRSLNAAAADGLSGACVNCVTSGQIASVSGSAVSGTIPVASVPAGSGSYIQNSTSLQASSNFNISGDGTLGGTLSANAVDATTQYSLGGSRVLSVAGTENLFAGVNAGSSNTGGIWNSFFGTYAGNSNTTGSFNSFFGKNSGLYNTLGESNSFFGRNSGSNNTTGSFNSFFGRHAGSSNTAGNYNTIIGPRANVEAGDLVNATALGSHALVSCNNCLVLGSVNGVNDATSDVNVGIGTTAPAFRLHIHNSGSAGLRVQTDTASGSVASFGGLGDFSIDAPGVPGGRVRVLENGNVGIGTTSPQYKLHVVGGNNHAIAGSSDTIGVRGGSGGGFGVYGYSGIGAGVYGDSPGGVAGYFNGNVYVTGTVTQGSDARIKQNINTLNYGLTEVLRLRSVSWRWRDHPERGRQLGLVAQEVEPVLPELVSTAKDAEQMKGVNYTGLLPVLVNAIQQQQAHIEAQRKEIADLKKLVCLDHPAADVCK